MKNELTKKIGRRILSEANDLKRTINALAKDLDIGEVYLEKVIEGNCEIKESHDVIKKMGSFYPIDISDLYIQNNDCKNSIKIMRSEESLSSSRVFHRVDKNKNKSEYYEYRDTAMSNMGPYKPEWIKELRYVDDDDPYNPDVAYNNGHFLHQTTFFVGPVNFYWEVDGKKYCSEMNTGDSNYITPFWPHSFTSRDQNQEAYILAITFGGEVRRAQKELYTIGKRLEKYRLDYRNHNKAVRQLINQHLKNENMTINHLGELCELNEIDIDLIKIMDNDKDISLNHLKIIAKFLNIELEDLLIPKYKPEDEVVINYRNKEKEYYFPKNNNRCYKIQTLARTSKMPQVKGFNIRVLKKYAEKNMITSLHSYIFNYSDDDIIIHWEDEGLNYEETIRKNDSIYIQPFVNHGFSCKSQNGKLYVVRAPGSMNFIAQKELSYFANIDRVFSETKAWFD